MNEAKKQKGLWYNIHQRRKKGLPRKKPNQKGYPETLNIEESVLRSVIRDTLLREYGLIDNLLYFPQSIIPGIMQIFKEIFGPGESERLIATGDDKVIEDYKIFLGTLHTLPEYKVVWENYKQAQRRHASMDRDHDDARDPRSPVGRAFNKLRAKVMGRINDIEIDLSPENKDIWKHSVDEARRTFQRTFSDWESHKITTGRVLALLDPKGIVEGKRKTGHNLREAGEMFWGKDLEEMRNSELSVAVEDVIMDLEDAGCPPHSKAMTKAEQILQDLTMLDHNLEQGIGEKIEMKVQELAEEIRSCQHIEPRWADEIADKVEVALNRYQEIDRH